MSIRFALVMLAWLAANGCGRRPPTFDAIAEGYVRASLKLAQHDPSLVEDWRGPDSWRPGARVPVAQLMEEIATLDRQLDIARSDISSAPEYARGQYLAAQLNALRFAAERQLGRAASIDDQAREEFGITLPPFDAAAAARVRDRLQRVLAGDAPLADRVATLRRAAIVPEDRRADVIGQSLSRCSSDTAAVVAMPPDESISFRFRSGLGWDATARYEGNHKTTIEINDEPLDVSRAFRLACHEGYPGHHVQHLLFDRLVEERRWPELRLTPGFGPHLLLAEGAADLGADLVLTREERKWLYREGLFPAAGLSGHSIDALVEVEDALIALLPVVTDVARQYLGGSITQARALERLADEALITNPAGTLAFIERRRARALVYGEGRRVVSELIKTKDLAGLYAAFKTAAAVQ